MELGCSCGQKNRQPLGKPHYVQARDIQGTEEDQGRDGGMTWIVLQNTGIESRETQTSGGQWEGLCPTTDI